MYKYFGVIGLCLRGLQTFQEERQSSSFSFFARHGKGALSLRDTQDMKLRMIARWKDALRNTLADSTICLIVHITISYYGAFAGLA